MTKVMRSILLPGVLVLLPALALAQSGPDKVVLEFMNLPTLDEAVDGHYEGWAIVDGAPVSTGKFNVSGSGDLVGIGGGPVIDEFDAGEDITDATAIKISIEPPGDASDAYILATPSDNHEDDMDDGRGIWWLTMPGPAAGLQNLPDLGPNWIYEG